MWPPALLFSRRRGSRFFCRRAGGGSGRGRGSYATRGAEWGRLNAVVPWGGLRGVWSFGAARYFCAGQAMKIDGRNGLGGTRRAPAA